MANSVNLANVNISLQQFQKMSSGTYNAGEVTLTSETTLGRLNNHVVFTGWNGKSISHTEVLAIKEAFVRALSDNGVGQAAIDQVRRELGLAPDGAVDVSLRERSIKPLSRKQIRDILDRNAEAINGFAQEHGIRGIRTGEQMRARLSEQEKTARDATRDTVNAALAGSRQIAEHRQIAVIEAVLSGDVDFLSTEDKRSALELAEKQLNTMLTNRKGTLSDTLMSDWCVTMTSGQKITMTTGLTETAFRAKLEDIIVRLRTGSSPRSCDLEVRTQFAALADASARLAFVTDLANDPAAACKARIVVVRLLQERGIADYATLSVANKLDRHEALALASRLIGLDANIKGDSLRNDPEFAELCAKPDLQLPAGEKAYIPATSGLVWNRDVFESVRLRQKHLLPQFEALCMDVVFETRGIYGDRGFPEGSHVFDSFGEQKFRDAFDFSGPNAPRVTAESLRDPLREAARMTACRRAAESAVKDALVAVGGEAADSTRAKNYVLARYPEIIDDLYAAQSRKDVDRVLAQYAGRINDILKTFVECKGIRSNLEKWVKEDLAARLNLPQAMLDGDTMIFIDLKKAGDALLDDVVKGKKPLKTKAEYEAAFREMARDYVDRKMACIGKIDALPYPEQIKTRMKAEVIRLETFGDINFDVLVEETAKIDVTELQGLLASKAAPNDILVAMRGIAEKVDAATNKMLAGKGEVGMDDRNLPYKMFAYAVIGSRPELVQLVKEFSETRLAEADENMLADNTGVIADMLFFAYGVNTEGDQTIVDAHEIETRFAPGGSAGQRALGMGYVRSELDMLKRTAMIYRKATGCTIDEAVKVSLDHKSAARRLVAYGGRFTESIENFNAGLRLLKDFRTWFAATNAAIEPMRALNGHPPAGATVTVINTVTANLDLESANAYEKFLFEEIAINKSIPLDAQDPERVFGMEANPAMRFVARGYTTSMANTCAQIPPEKRQLLYDVFDLLAPLGRTEAEVEANQPIKALNVEIMARVLRHYDEIAAMKAAGELTKANFLSRFFTDIPGAADMTPRQMLDAFFGRLDGPIMTNILQGHFEHVPNVTIMVQNAGATLEEAARAAMEGRRLPLAPYVTDVAGMLKELDGTAEGGRKTMLRDFVRPSPPHRIEDKTSVIDEANTVFKVVFPDGTEMKSMSGDERNDDVAANNDAIAGKVAEFCGDVHPAQLSSVYFALSQAAASPVKDGFLNRGIKSDEHTALTYTLSKNDETGAITVTYSEPEGFPFHFHWTATVAIDGTTTTTPMVIERQ